MSDCGYQDVDCWVRQLLAAGWKEVRHDMWLSPGGALYRGPYGAWKVMREAPGKKTEREG